MSLARRFIAVSIVSLLPFTAQAADSPVPATAPAAPAPAISAPPVSAPAAITAPAAGAASAINPNAPVSRAELPELVKETILNDPDIIMKAIEKIRQQQADKSRDDMKSGLEKHKAELLNDPTSPSVGPKNADVTVVEFFDYHCGYCKKLMPAIQKLSENDKKVRIVFREFPILSEDSVTAARAALAVNKIDPAKYFAFHMALMQTPGRFDEKTLLEVAKKVGVNPEKLKAAINDPDSTAILDKNRAIAEDLGIRGTPAIIIGDQVIPGAMSYEDLRNMVDQAHADKSKPAAEAHSKS